MDLFLLNIQWMAFNASLAVLGAVLGWFALKTVGFVRFLFVGAWFLFIPNTIYMVTDMAHLTWELPAVDPVWWLPITMQFLLLATLGVITFVLGFYPVEKLLHHYRKKHHFDYAMTIVIIMNIFIGMGVMLGREYRLHSWYVITQTTRVANSILDFSTSIELVAVSFLIGIIGFIVYILLRNDVTTFLPKKFQ